MAAFCLKTVVVIMLTMMVVVTDTDIGCDLCGYNNGGRGVGDRSGHLGEEGANDGGDEMMRLWWWWWWWWW